MRQPTEQFRVAVQEAWGEPERVAEVGIRETFNHEDVFGFDHNDQVDNAMRIGVLAGKTANTDPNSFVEEFTTLLNED